MTFKGGRILQMNACVPPKFKLEALTPNIMILRGVLLKVSFCQEDKAKMIEINAIKIEPP